MPGSRPVRMTILGQEFAGEVESVGEKVTCFAVGDRIFGVPGFSLGGYAEYICLAESGSDEALATMPYNMSYEQAAAVHFGGMESLHFLRKAQVQDGEHVLVNGSGGGQVISATQSLSEIISSADIVVGAVGKPEFIKGQWIKTEAVVVDAGYHPGNVGDIELSAVIDKCAAYTPVPGGVGPMTIATLIAQTVAAAEKSV